MAKQRHPQTDPQSSRTALILLTGGGLLVGGLVVWALVRTVQAPPGPVEKPPVATAPVGTATGNVEVPAPPAATSTTTPPRPEVQGDQSEVPRIAAEDLREQQKSGAVTIIDVRDAAAFAAGHIAGSLNMPFASIEGFVDMIPKGKPVVTYCT